MAGGMDLGDGGKKGKKPLDTSINLVPFIDLMAVTITFLIMTAVWTQVGRLQVAQQGNSTDDQPPPDQIPPIVLLVTEKELKLTVGGSQMDPIAVTRVSGSDRIDLAKLNGKLKEAKTAVPQQNAITLQTEDAVKYDDLVAIIDECLGAEFPSVTVSPAST